MHTYTALFTLHTQNLGMRIISYNVNGIRSAINKGFIEWLKTKPADVVCLQETKAQEQNVNPQLFNEAGYKGWWFSAQKKGTAGWLYLV